MMTFDLLVPTRGRPANMRRLAESIAATAIHPERVALWFYIDSDDFESIAVLPEMRTDFPAIRIEHVQSLRLPLVDCYNILSGYAGDGILWSGGDDIVFRTQSWDVLVEAEFVTRPDKLVLVYGDDGLQPEQPATHPFVSRESVNTLGYFYPEVPEGVNLTDVWLHSLYASVGRLVYRPDISTDHLHWLRGLAQRDATYDGEYTNNFPRVMEAMRRNTPKLARDGHKLKAAILRERRSRQC
jgi:hypothetical protein